MASDVHVLGDGVAAMMLAARADELGAQTLSIVRPDGAPAPKDHMLGFWATPGPRGCRKAHPSLMVDLVGHQRRCNSIARL